MTRFSAPVFSMTFCLVYVGILFLDLPLFLYYPETGQLRWYGDRIDGAGPAMAWYGLLASTTLISSITAFIVPSKSVTGAVAKMSWITPWLALAGCAYLMRHLLLT